jgi:NADP-dependent 3-hydroxy acid dehydrogenase YdfG
MPDQVKRIAIVTGATSGIGEAIVRKFVAAGFGVVGNARSAQRLVALENELGAAFCSVAGDAADPAVVERLFVNAERCFGRAADIVVANAGRGLGGSVKDADLTPFGEVLSTNVAGVALLIQKAARQMVAVQEQAFPDAAADILIIGSVAGRQISPFSAVYSASKFAVHALAESLRREVATKGVRVSLVAPGAVLTGFQSAAGYDDDVVNGFREKYGPLLNTEDVADAVHHIVIQPPHVHISDIIVRPTRMDYP